MHVQVRLRRLLASEMTTAAAVCASSADGSSFSGGSGVAADMAMSPVTSFRREVDALYAALGLSDDEDG
jgi:hypothetical protein